MTLNCKTFEATERMRSRNRDHEAGCYCMSLCTGGPCRGYRKLFTSNPLQNDAVTLVLRIPRDGWRTGRVEPFPSASSTTACSLQTLRSYAHNRVGKERHAEETSSFPDV